MERYYTLPEFLKELGIGKNTYLRYRARGILPLAPREGARPVLSQAYLERCRRALRGRTIKRGRPRKTASSHHQEG
jgi:hypothetical protein